MQGFLYEEASFGQFLLVTIVMGGWVAWRTGRSVAGGWQDYWLVVAYTLLIGAAVRFIHYALFGGTLLTLQFYVVDTVLLLLFSTAGFRTRRTQQMTNNYYWLYEKTSPFSWREK